MVHIAWGQCFNLRWYQTLQNYTKKFSTVDNSSLSIHHVSSITTCWNQNYLHITKFSDNEHSKRYQIPGCVVVLVAAHKPELESRRIENVISISRFIKAEVKTNVCTCNLTSKCQRSENWNSAWVTGMCMKQQCTF
jgi:hypothetical protein